MRNTLTVQTYTMVKSESGKVVLPISESTLFNIAGKRRSKPAIARPAIEAQSTTLRPIRCRKRLGEETPSEIRFINMKPQVKMKIFCKEVQMAA